MKVEYIQALILAGPTLLLAIWGGRELWRAGHRRMVQWVTLGCTAATLAMVAPLMMTRHLAAMLVAGAGVLLVAPVALGLMIAMAMGRR
ncbi:hypothetical protein [Pseudothioclava arenosa]|uniref:Uncharacterized protein n=1 Tax=Pseudothioclava arenosa TaxID=1795308 RepID=A0A2A4CTJ1_9RHOB|nr:hypothetical protein [Pseudothioclava arenosa]PCD77572.1 hypothetical protein CLN94_03445 [Pseudothioclava arenosa]